MDDLSSLHAQIARLTEENGKLHAENKARRLKYKKSGEELATATSELEKLRKDNEDLRSRSETVPDEWREKYENLQGKVRDHNHKSVFSSIAKELKVRDEAIDDLYHLSGYKAESDEPDPEHLRNVVGELVKAKSYLLAPEPVAETGKMRLPAGPNVNRPGLEPTSRRQVSKSDMRDFRFMSKHQNEIAIGLKDGTIEIID